MIRALNPPGKLAFFRRTNLCSPVAAYVVKRAYRPALFSSHDHALAYDMCQKILPGLLDLLASPHAHPHPEIESLHLLAKESRVRIILPLQCLHLHRLTFRYRRPACLAQVPSQNRQAMPRSSKNSLISVPGITSSLFQLLDPASLQSNSHSFKKEFQQLGQDLQSGNLAQAQANFAALQPPTPPVSSSSQSSSNSLASAFSQLSNDLQSGNLSAAQQDYSNIQTDLQQSASVSGLHHHHHHHHVESSQDSSQDSSQISLSSLFSQLGQALQSGNLSAAQSAYTSLRQEFAQFAPGASTSTSSPTSAGSSASINLTA